MWMYLPVAALIKGHERMKHCFLSACCHYSWQVHPSCPCPVSLLVLKSPSLAFQHILKTSSSPGITQAFNARLGWPRHPACGLDAATGVSQPLRYEASSKLLRPDGIRTPNIFIYYINYILAYQFCSLKEP